MKAKKCKICKTEFEPRLSLQKVCSTGCAIKLVEQDKQKRIKKGIRKDRERLKPRSEHTKEAQQAFNRYIRARDRSEPCISCGRHHQGQYHAGHYRTVGSNPELRFIEYNVRKQCQPCNMHLSGNLINYRIALIKKIGEDNVNWIEGNHPLRKYTIDELKEIKKEYNAWARELEKNE